MSENIFLKFSDCIEIKFWREMVKVFNDGGPYYIEASPFICIANQWAGFCMMGTSVMKELKGKLDLPKMR